MNLAELRASLKAKNDELAKLAALPEWDEEQRTLATTLDAEIVALEDPIKAAVAQNQADAELRQRATARSQQHRNQSAGRQSAAAQPGTHIVSQREAWADDPMHGFRSSREFLLAVMEADSGRGVDQRLQGLRATAGSDEQSGQSDSYGRYLVPEAMLSGIRMTTVEGDPFAGRTESIPMSAPTVKIPARVDKNHTTSVSGGLTVGRRVETQAGSSSRMQLELISLEANGLYGIGYCTEELLSDSPVSFAQLISDGFSDEFGSRLLYERLYGTGVGEFMGILNSPALVSVAKETGQVAATIKRENIVNMRSRCWGYQNAIWLANHDTLPRLAELNFEVGTGGAAWWMPSGTEDAPDMLLGRPLYLTEYCETLGTTGDLLCVNPTQYLEGTYQPLQSAESVHVRFLQNERTFRFTMRNAGAPWWSSALTPKKGASTLSPFVSLATRA